MLPSAYNPPPPHHTHLRLTNISSPPLSPRPCDGNETAGVYKVAIENIYKQNPAGIVRPSTMVLSRQNLPNQPGSSIEKTSKGGYVIYGDENEKPDVIVIATGMERWGGVVREHVCVHIHERVHT